MHPNSQIPEPNTYGKVLRRTDRDPRLAHQIRYVGYDVTLRAVAAELDGKTAPMIFFPEGKDAAAHRATRLGWVDVTDKWNEAIGRKLDPQYAAKQLSALRHTVKSMGWHALRAYAKERNIVGTGERSEIEARVMEWHAAQVEME